MSDSKTYAPSPEFAAHANVNSIAEYRELYDRARKNPEVFWAELGLNELTWFRPFSQALEWEPPYAKWFAGGKINACYNCVDRHLATARKAKPAFIFEGEPGDQRVITYGELHRLVSRFATTLKQLGYQTGDRAVIYMPMIPELPIALLACARLGITHSVVFAGFSAEALKARILDLNATVVITADGGWRRGKRSTSQGRRGRGFGGLPGGPQSNCVQTHRLSGADEGRARFVVARTGRILVERPLSESSGRKLSR
jgi:acetyl-CoA synthetase